MKTQFVDSSSDRNNPQPRVQVCLLVGLESLVIRGVNYLDCVYLRHLMALEYELNKVATKNVSVNFMKKTHFYILLVVGVSLNHSGSSKVTNSSSINTCYCICFAHFKSRINCGSFQKQNVPVPVPILAKKRRPHPGKKHCPDRSILITPAELNSPLDTVMIRIIRTPRFCQVAFCF